MGLGESWGFLNETEAEKSSFVQVVQQIFVMADRGQITFVFRVLDRDFFRGAPVSVVDVLAKARVEAAAKLKE